MKFSCTQENLNHGLGVVSHITARNANLPILHNIMIEAKDDGIEFAATNLEIGIRVQVRGKVEEAGAFTVPAQIIANYVNLINAERVDLEREDMSLFISAGNQNTKIRGEEATEFPLIPEVERVNPVVIPAEELRKALSQVVIAVSTDDTNPVLTGVLFKMGGQQLVMAATNSYRLAERKISLSKDVGKECSVIVPGPALRELVRVLQEGSEHNVEMYFSDNQALFVTDQVEITTNKLIEGAFPDYEQVIPTEERTKAVLDKEELIRAAKAASLFSKAGIHDLNMHFSPEKQMVTLTTVNNQVGENVSKVPAEISGDSNNIIFNYRYLIEGAAQMASQKITMHIIDNVTAGMLRPVDDGSIDYTYIIMPIKQ